MKEKPRFLQSKSHFEKSTVAVNVGFSVLEGASGDEEVGVASLYEDGEFLKEVLSCQSFVTSRSGCLEAGKVPDVVRGAGFPSSVETGRGTKARPSSEQAA